MPEDTSLRDFILGYCRQVGGLVEPPVYGVDEVLLPDEIATRWGVDPFQRFTFTPIDSSPQALEAEPDEGVTPLFYGHPLVEMIVSEIRQHPANTRLYINPPRLEKPGLRDLVEKSLTLANARPTAGHGQRTRLYHYVCFNFKASLVSDEKRELLVSLWMHLQGGYRVSAMDILGRTTLDPENASPNLETSLPVWSAVEPGADPLSPEILSNLLDRARFAVKDEIAPIIEAAQNRSRRFLQLDRARLEDYYKDLQRDLEKRLARADDDRRTTLQAKLAALQVERQSKLDDAEQKYRLRLELELVNLAIIAQPKIELDVEIRKRGVAVMRPVAWDPVRHILEPLVCNVCGLPGEGLYLCENGHLAHVACLAPQCVDCKRTFCQLCSVSVHTCVVCDAPVCIQSLVGCKTCGRETCQKHVELCHAASGQPQRITTQTLLHKPAPQVIVETPEAESPKPSKAAGKSKPAQAKKPAKPAARPKAVAAQRIQVELETGRAEIRAFALKKEQEIAVRTWELADQGIAVTCYCEKGWGCHYNGLVYRPMDASQIEGQLARMIGEFADEYAVPRKKINYMRKIGGRILEDRRLNLPPAWKSPEMLASAQEAFDNQPRW